MIRDIDAVGFTFQGENLCRYCTRDVLETMVLENAYRLPDPDALDGLGILDLMRICDEFIPYDIVVSGTDAYNDEEYDSDDYPKPFTDAIHGEVCMNLECEMDLEAVYHVILLSRR